ncbi:hypothetical protein P2318_16095 [Myxococcaceae bacterium GXIMD 01537]
MAALRRVARVRPGHHDSACREVHVRLAQRQQLALAHPGEERRGEQRAPAALQGRQHQRNLLGLEVLRQLLRLLVARDGLGGIEAGEETTPDRQLEDAVEEGAQVVERLWRQIPDLGVEQYLQARRRDVLEGQGPQLVAQMLLAEADDGGGAEPAAHLGLPRVQGLPEGDLLAMLGQGLQAAPLAVGLNLQVVQEGARLRLRGGLGRGVAPPSVAVLEPHVPSVVYFAELVPTSMPEAVIVAQFAELNWRLERLTRVENNRHRARLEEELEKTDTYKTTACTRHALELVDAIALTVEAVPIPPQDAEQMGTILTGVERIVGFLGEVPELPAAVVQPLSQALDAAKKSLSKDHVKKDEYEALGNMAKMVRGALREKLAREEAALQPLRERLAAEVLLLEDADLKKLERHRRLLENSMQRQLALLTQVRALVTTARPEAQVEAKELRVKLRVVK